MCQLWQILHSECALVYRYWMSSSPYLDALVLDPSRIREAVRTFSPARVIGVRPVSLRWHKCHLGAKIVENVSTILRPYKFL